MSPGTPLGSFCVLSGVERTAVKSGKRNECDGSVKLPSGTH